MTSAAEAPRQLRNVACNAPHGHRVQTLPRQDGDSHRRSLTIFEVRLSPIAHHPPGMPARATQPPPIDTRFPPGSIKAPAGPRVGNRSQVRDQPRRSGAAAGEAASLTPGQHVLRDQRKCSRSAGVYDHVVFGAASFTLPQLLPRWACADSPPQCGESVVSCRK